MRSRLGASRARLCDGAHGAPQPNCVCHLHSPGPDRRAPGGYPGVGCHPPRHGAGVRSAVLPPDRLPLRGGAAGRVAAVEPEDCRGDADRPGGGRERCARRAVPWPRGGHMGGPPGFAVRLGPIRPHAHGPHTPGEGEHGHRRCHLAAAAAGRAADPALRSLWRGRRCSVPAMRLNLRVGGRVPQHVRPGPCAAFCDYIGGLCLLFPLRPCRAMSSVGTSQFRPLGKFYRTRTPACGNSCKRSTRALCGFDRCCSASKGGGNAAVAARLLPRTHPATRTWSTM